MNTRQSPRLTGQTRRFLRTHDVFTALPDLGPLYAQTRGVGGGLGRKVGTLQPLFVDGLDFAFDPDHALGFAVKEIVAIHATIPSTDSFFRGTIEFEFAGHPQGLGLHLLPEGEASARLALRTLIDSSPTEALAETDLVALRERCRQPLPMCPCCQDRARYRARHPEAHPIHAILEHALEQRIVLDVRLPAPHVDLAASFRPERIETKEGFLIVSDGPAEHALHLDMRRLHGLAIDTVRLDGWDYATLRLFDPSGLVTFQILADNAALASVWREICETLET